MVDPSIIWSKGSQLLGNGNILVAQVGAKGYATSIGGINIRDATDGAITSVNVIMTDKGIRYISVNTATGTYNLQSAARVFKNNTLDVSALLANPNAVIFRDQSITI